MIPGDVFHVDAIVSEQEGPLRRGPPVPEAPLRADPPGRRHLRDAHRARAGARSSADPGDPRQGHRAPRPGARRDATPSSSVGRDDGKVYFLETAARVGGAHIADLVEASTGVNLWREWAKIEIAQGDEPYDAPRGAGGTTAGLILSLARQEKPDTSAYTDPGDRLAPRRPPASPRRADRALGRPRARRGAARPVRAAHRPRLHGHAARAPRRPRARPARACHAGSNTGLPSPLPTAAIASSIWSNGYVRPSVVLA